MQSDVISEPRVYAWLRLNKSCKFMLEHIVPRVAVLQNHY